jgi:hypothetical protein
MVCTTCHPLDLLWIFRMQHDIVWDMNHFFFNAPWPHWLEVLPVYLCVLGPFYYAGFQYITALMFCWLAFCLLGWFDALVILLEVCMIHEQGRLPLGCRNRARAEHRRLTAGIEVQTTAEHIYGSSAADRGKGTRKPMVRSWSKRR